MGFCSGTQIFDDVADEIIDQRWIPEAYQRSLIRALVRALQDHDWDCEGHSRYYDHPIMQSVLRELNPDWFEDEEDE